MNLSLLISSFEGSFLNLWTNETISGEIQIIKDSYELEKYIQEKILPLSTEEVSLVEKYLRTNKTLLERNLTAIYCYQ